MRFEIVGKNLTFEEGKIGEVQKVKSLMLQTQTLSPPYDVVRSEFLIEGTELEGYINEGLTYEDIVELKLKALLEVDVTPLDAHQFANIEKQAINAIVEVRSAREDLDVAKAEIKASTKNDVEEAKRIIEDELEETLKAAKIEIEEIANAKILEETEKVKDIVRSIVKIDELSKEQLNNIIKLYRPWKAGEDYVKDEIVSYNHKLYRVIKGLKNALENHAPDVAISEYTEVQPKTTESGEEIIPEFVQPSGEHDAYKVGDKVIFKNNIYESLIDGNAHSPEAYAAGWQLIE